MEYIFARECSADEPEVSQEAVLRDLDKKIEKEKGSIRETKIGLLIALVILAVCVFSMGRAALSGDTLLIALRFFGPTALIAFAGGYWEIRKLRRKKERVEDGDIPDEYTNWRKDRVIKALFLLSAEPITAATLMIKPLTCRRKAPTPSCLRCVWKV